MKPIGLLAAAVFAAGCASDVTEPVISGPQFANGSAVTRIAPPAAKPGRPFSIFDPDGRLVDGSVAVFTISGTKTEVPLQIRQSFMTAQGTLPTEMTPGDYTVSVKSPAGGEFDVGPFSVRA
jgi:hypothetical protein